MSKSTARPQLSRCLDASETQHRHAPSLHTAPAPPGAGATCAPSSRTKPALAVSLPTPTPAPAPAPTRAPSGSVPGHTCLLPDLLDLPAPPSGTTTSVCELNTDRPVLDISPYPAPTAASTKATPPPTLGLRRHLPAAWRALRDRRPCRPRPASTAPTG